METNKEIDIDLKTIFLLLKRKTIYIVLFAVIGGILTGSITNFFIEPKYTACITLCAYSDTNRIVTDGSITSGQIEASQKLVNSYSEILKSNTVLEQVAQKLNGSVSASQIKRMMSCSQIEDTFIFRVYITSADPQQAMDIANTIAEICPEEIVKILNAGSVQVVDFAKFPVKPSSPNIKKNVVIGFAAAFLAAFVYFFIKEALDTSIVDEKDLERAFTIPVLGTIPRLVSAENDDKRKNDDADLLKSTQLKNTDSNITMKGE